MSEITPPLPTTAPAAAPPSAVALLVEALALPAPTRTSDPADPTDSTDGRSTRWADHREARRAELVRIARKVVHAHGPDVSMDEIATAAGTSKSIVYRYFTDKTGLQIAVAEAVVLQIRGALEGALRASPTPRDGLRAMVGVYLEMIESSPNVYFFVTREGSLESGSPLGHFLDSVTALVAAPFARALLDAGSPADAENRAMAETWAAGAVGFVRGAGERWLRQQGDAGAPDRAGLDRATLTTQVASWLWAGPVGVLTRARSGVVGPDDPTPPHDETPPHDPNITTDRLPEPAPAQEPR